MRYLSILALAATVLSLAAPIAEARLSMNGKDINGKDINGIAANRLSMNGTTSNRLSMNARAMNVRILNTNVSGMVDLSHGLNLALASVVLADGKTIIAE